MLEIIFLFLTNVILRILLRMTNVLGFSQRSLYRKKMHLTMDKISCFLKIQIFSHGLNGRDIKEKL